MPRTTNEQSLLQDRASRILAACGVSSAALVWRGPRTLLVHVEPDEWAAARRSMTDVEAAATDRGFKALLIAPGAEAGVPVGHTGTLAGRPVRNLFAERGAPRRSPGDDGDIDERIL